MSSLSSKPQEMKKVDAVVLAGSRGTRLFEVDGEMIPKPHLRLGGEALVSRVARAVLGARRIHRVYVVGQIDLLRQSLAGLLSEAPDRLRLIEEGQDILDNSYRAFFLHVVRDQKLDPIQSPHLDPVVIGDYRKRYLEHLNLPAFYITADLPFVSTQAVDEFLDACPDEAAVVMGLVNHNQLQRMRSMLCHECALEYWKLGSLQLRSQSVRLNNLFLVRPLQVDPAFYRLLSQLYAHRWLLTQDGKVNFKNWWAIVRATISYSLRLRGFFRFLRGVFNFVPAALASCLAKFTHRFGRWVSWPFRQFVSKRDVEFICSLMMGARGHLVVTENPGSAIDVDVEESYHSLIQDDEKDFKMIAGYLAGLELAPPPADPPEEHKPQAQTQA